MTLKEAVESGRPFRHKGDLDWCLWDKEEDHIILKDSAIIATKKNPVFHPFLSKLISDDWEIQQKETFTREDVERAVNMYAGCRGYGNSQSHEDAYKAAMKAAESCGNGSDNRSER